MDTPELSPGSDSAGPAAVTAWLVSLAFHTACLGAMFLVVFPLAGDDASRALPVVQVQVVGDPDALPVPASRKSTGGTGAGFGASATSPPRFEPQLPQGAETFDRLQPNASGAGPDLSVIGIGSEGSFGGGGPGQFGLTLDGGGGGGPEFFGVTAAAPGARAIIYVVDRSGSMVDTFNRVRAELRRSISALRRSQKFHVIFFNAADPLESPPLRPVNAIEAHKQQFFTFLETVSPSGGTKPERALRKALALEPDILYFLSDGIFDPEVLRKLDEWNHERRTRIYTIAYLDQGGRKLLETIAREHGGESRFVSEDDLP